MMQSRDDTGFYAISLSKPLRKHRFSVLRLNGTVDLLKSGDGEATIVCARAATVLKASRGRYPAGIGVNREIVLDERH